MNTAVATEANLSEKPLIPIAGYWQGRDYPEVQSLRNHPDFPVFNVVAHGIPSEFSPAASAGSIGTGGIPTKNGLLGTLRLQIEDHQFCFVVNPSDPAIRKCLAAWRAAGRAAIALNLGDKVIALFPKVPRDFGRQLEMAATRKSVSPTQFVRYALYFIGTGLLASQATSDVKRYPVLRTATAYLVRTDAISDAMDSVLADIDARGEFAVEPGFTVKHGGVVESC